MADKQRQRRHARQSGEGGRQEDQQRTRRAAASGGETLRAAADAMRQGVDVTGRGQRQATERTIEQTQQASRGMVEAAGMYGKVMQNASQKAQAMVECSRAVSDGIPATQRALMEWLTQSFHATTRFSQDLFHVRNIHDLAELQTRLVEESLDRAIDGSEKLLRSMREAMAEALEPLYAETREGGGGSGGRGRGRGGRREGGAKVADVMTPDVQMIEPDQTVQEAAQKMSEEDTGVLPVAQDDRLVGMVTDRDLAVRVLAEGKDPADTKVSEVMTPDVKYVFEDQDVQEVSENMAEQQLRRMPVLNRDKRLVGIVSLGDLATQQPHVAGRALGGISRPGGQHHTGESEAA